MNRIESPGAAKRHAHGGANGRIAAPRAGPPRWESPEWQLAVSDISPLRRAFNRLVILVGDGTLDGLRRHWLALVNAIFAAVVGVALLVPLLFAAGWDGLAMRIFTAYHLICEQIPSHSYYFFGYQLALCSRNLAIYGSLLAGTLLFHRVRAWWPRLDWSLWLLTMVPMALDGGTQLFGWRESTWELRTLTGVIFGLGVCWFLLPLLEDAAAGTAPGGRPLTLDLRILRAFTPRYRAQAPARSL